MKIFGGTPGSRLEPLNAMMVTLARPLLVATVFFVPISTAATNLFMALTLLAWLGAGQFRRRLLTLRGNLVVYAVLAVFGLSCVGSLYSSGSLHDIAFQMHKNSRLLFFIPALSLLEDPIWRQRCLRAFIASMLITLTLSMISTAIPLAVVKGTVGGAMGNHFVFKDHIAQNLMMSFFVLIMLSAGQSAKNNTERYSWYSIALLAIVNILFFVQGRTGYVSLALNLLAFLLLMTKGHQRIVFAMVLIILGALTQTYSSNFNQRVLTTIKEFNERESKELTSVGQRIEFIDKSMQLIIERPIFGYGTGAYGKEFCRLAESAEWCDAGKAHPHNQFMSMGVQFGAIGILVYLSLIASIIWQSRQRVPRDRLLAMGIAITLIVDSLFHAPLFLVTEAQFFTLMMAVAVAGGSQPDRIIDK